MQTNKRTWSLILVLVMVLSVFGGMPVTAFAEDELDSTPLGISFTSADGYTCTEGTGGTFQVTAKGADSIEYALDGEPEGVSIVGETGLLTVKDTVKADEYEFNITASDADGEAEPAAQSFTLTVEAKVGVGPMRAPAPGAFPDLGFTLAPGSSVSMTKLTGVTNVDGTPGNIFKITNDGTISTHPENYNISTTGAEVPDPTNFEFPITVRIGSYLNLYEAYSGGLLANRGYVQIDNSHLLAPTPGTTAIAGGAGKVTVSSYQAVTGCTLYLVPDSLYPAGDGAIDIASATEITANGDISCAAGDYTLYTVYTGSLVSPRHGAYVAGSEVTVTAVSSATIDITGQTVTFIEGAINDLLTGSNSSGYNPLFAVYDIVTVTGSKTDVNTFLTLNIPTSKKVIWKATYTANATFSGNMITITDASTGTFEVADGTITAADTGTAIYALGGDVIVSGGTVSAATGIAISGGYVEVSSGTVSATGDDNTIEAATATMSGGTIKATGANGTAIYADNTVTLTGGTVSATTGTAIEATTVKATSGTVTVGNNVGAANPAIKTGGFSGWGVVEVSGGTLNVTGNIEAIDISSVGVNCLGGTVNVTGNITADGEGVYAENGGTVTVTGDITAGNNIGVECYDSGTTVDVTGDITAGDTSIVAEGGAIVNVTGSVTSTYGAGAYADGNTTQVTVGSVNGNIGVIAETGGTITVTGNITAASTGVYAESDAKVYVKDTITGTPKVYILDANAVQSPSDNASYTNMYTHTGGTDTSKVYEKAVAAPTVSATPVNRSGHTANGSSSGGSSTPSTNWTVSVGKQPNMPTTATVSIPGTVDANGNLSCTVTDAMMKDAIKKAQAEAKRLGKPADGIIIEIKVTTTNGVKTLTAKLNQAALDRLNTAGAGMSVNSSIFRFTLDNKAVKELNTQAKNGLTFTATPVAKLSDAATAVIGTRPVYDFTAKDGSGKVITSYGKGTITRGIRYTAANGEKTGSLCIVKIVDGKVQWIGKSSYDNGWIIWSGNSNSVYGVGCKTPAPAFTDTTNHWAKNDIDFVASRGLISGTGATTFAPNTAINRADFLMALGKLSGADVSGYKTSSFTDVKSTDPAMPYIEWAVQKKIVQGIGNNQFGPDRLISRQDMAVMMVNYAKATGYTLPVSRQAVTFADNDKISAYAKDVVKAIQQTGVMNGKGNNLFDPQGNATRGEASAILHRFVELVIDEGTARGWVQNDAGQWQYINTNGKAVTGWLTVATNGSKYWFDDKGIMVSGKWVQIDGKWYYFYDSGKLAVSTTIEGYTVGEDGARK